MNYPRANSFFSSSPTSSPLPSVANHHTQSTHTSTSSRDKYLSDRYLPLRRGPSASRELFTDSHGWPGLAQRYGSASDSEPGHLVKDVYRAEILGQNLNEGKNKGFEPFSNENFLRYNLKEQTNQKFESLFDRKVIATEIQPKKKPRRISKFPYRVLDAPLLLNDFYLNLLDWSNWNQLGVGLARNVYLWDANSMKTHMLFTLGERRHVTSVSFSPSNVLAAGANDGTIELWDCNKNRCVHSYFGQQDRVGSLSWKNSTILASGSRDYSIMIRDTRAARPVIKTLNHHSEEVCGVKWSHDEQQLASGGIDNKLLIWEMHYPKPVFSIQRHEAAVKALAWSPHQHGLLATGGGSRDSTIRLWNSRTGEELNCLYAGSQVSSLIFGKTTNELVSAQGYNLNEINIWSMPNMQRVASLVGHTSRVLFMAMSPDGASIVTGGADESIRFWKVFPPEKKEEGMKSKLSNDATSLR